MKKWRYTLCRMLTGLVLLYGVTSACVCADHTSPAVATSPCHQCHGSDADTEGVRIASHHQCCGMQHAPIAIEKVSSADPVVIAGVLALHAVSLHPDSGSHGVALSARSQAPPAGVPIYLSINHFII